MREFPGVAAPHPATALRLLLLGMAVDEALGASVWAEFLI
jgi:hypothetical protein